MEFPSDEEIKGMLENYDRALQLRSWADLFNFDIGMGRTEEGSPMVCLEGTYITAGEVRDALVIAARAMGMSEERLDGERGDELPPSLFMRLR